MLNKFNGLALSLLFLVSLLLMFASTSSGTDGTIILSKKNTVILSSEIDGDSVGQAIADAKRIDSKHKKSPIYLFMNTPGGDIQAGMELLESLHGLSRPVNTITLFSASMGFELVQNLGDRLILQNGILMSHRAVGEFKGSFGGKRPSQMDNRYNLWLSRIQEFDEQTVKRTNGKQTLDSYQKAYSDELWLTGKQAVESGYADRIVTVKCDSSLSGFTTHNMSLFGLTILYDLDNCPVHTSPMNIRIGSSDQKNGLPQGQVEEIKAKFVQLYTLKLHTVIPPYW